MDMGMRRLALSFPENSEILGSRRGSRELGSNFQPWHEEDGSKKEGKERVWREKEVGECYGGFKLLEELM